METTAPASMIGAVIKEIGFSWNYVFGRYDIISLNHKNAQYLMEEGLSHMDIVISSISEKLIRMGEETYETLTGTGRIIEHGNPPPCLHMLAFALTRNAFPSPTDVLQTIGARSIEDVVAICKSSMDKTRNLEIIFLDRLHEKAEYEIKIGNKRKRA